MKILSTLALTLLLFPTHGRAVIEATQVVSRIDFLYSASNSGTATAILATSDGSAGSTLSGFNVDLTLDHQFHFTIAAPPGMKFMAQLPRGPRLDLFSLGFNGSLFKDASLAGSPVISYTGLVGAGGTLSGGDEFLLPSDASRLGLAATTTEFSPSFEFQTVTFSWSYDPGSFSGGGATAYAPTQGTIQMYGLNEGADPGRWLRIQPIPEPTSPALMASATLGLAASRLARSRTARSSRKSA